MFDRCIFRDPHILLPGGYQLGAVSRISPVQLGYIGYNDDRMYSDFIAMIVSRENDSSGRPIWSYAIWNQKTKEEYLFSKESEWLEAMSELNVKPSVNHIRLEGVTSYAANKSHIIGEYEEGFYIWDIAKNFPTTFNDKETWISAVNAQTKLSPTKLQSPYNYFRFYRGKFPLVYACIIISVIAVNVLKGNVAPKEQVQ